MHALETYKKRIDRNTKLSSVLKTLLNHHSRKTIIRKKKRTADHPTYLICSMKKY